jgi:UDP-N-acetylglucosamine 4-epimerase
VANVVDGVLRATTAPNASGEVINLAVGDRISLNRLFFAIRDLTGATVDPSYGPERVGDVKDSQADISKARRILGYEPLVSFDEGLAKTVAWYKANTKPTHA